MNMILRRLFGASTRKPAPISGLPLADIQRSLCKALQGCQGVRVDRLFYKIKSSKTPAELWALRTELHQCIAQIHTEGVAADRINGLSTVFNGWIPAAQLTKITPYSKPT